MTKIATHCEKPIQSELVRQLYDESNWWPERTLQDITQMLDQNSEYTYGLWIGGDLAAFCRLVSDGIFRAYVEDFVVGKSYRQQGLGKQLMEYVHEHNNHIHIISLFSDEELSNYYSNLGYRSYPAQKVFHYYHKQ